MKNFFLFLFFFLGAFALTFGTIDPDFGWHLQSGRHILASGIPLTDPFSYTMPSFAYIDHSWSVDVVTALLFGADRLWPLALVTAFVATATLFLSIRIEKPTVWSRLPLILGAVVLLQYVALRPLVVTWVFFTLLLWICWENYRWEKLKYYLPILFLFWANAHAGFVSGLLILGLKVSTNWPIKKPTFIKEGLLFATCLIITLINPYHFGLWREVVSTLGSPSLHLSIGEWVPGIFFFDPLVAIIGTLGGLLLWRYHGRFTFFQKVLYILTLVSAITAVRNVPLWIIVSIPIITKSLGLFAKEVRKIPLGWERFLKVYRIFTVLIMVMATYLIFQRLESANNFTANQYPRAATEFLKRKNLSGNLFAPYNWGGYLIWQYPEEKTFVDGRMPHWKNDQEPLSESKDAFMEYTSILGGTLPYQAIFDRHTIKSVLLQKTPKQQESSLNTYVRNLLKLMGILPKRSVQDSLADRLTKDNWVKTYEDDVAVIYQKESSK